MQDIQNLLAASDNNSIPVSPDDSVVSPPDVVDVPAVAELPGVEASPQQV